MLFGDAPLEALVIDAPGQEPWHSIANARDKLATGDRAGALRTNLHDESLTEFSTKKDSSRQMEFAYHFPLAINLPGDIRVVVTPALWIA
jgi:hypothetical protein